MANKSFGKNLLRVSSMFIAVLMLVLTTFTGMTTMAITNTPLDQNTIKATSVGGGELGQIVVLEAGKTYAFSYYYSAPSFAKGYILDGDGTSNTAFTPTNVIYDNEYNKVTYEFVAPATATPADEEGKVKVYLGMYVPSSETCYYYYPSVYAIDDETKTNLFRDPEFQGVVSTNGVWQRIWGAALGSRFVKYNISALGGLDFFKKTDDERYAVKLAANSDSKYTYFGQWVTLKAGKTYTLSNCYTDDNLGCLIRQEDGTGITVDIENYDNDYFRKNVTFTVPADSENVDKRIWVGIQGYKRTYDVYYYDFKLYDVKNPEVNLFKDYALIENGSNLKTAWKRPSGELYLSYYTRATLTEAGGIAAFERPETDRYVLSLKAGIKAADAVLGQKVALKPGETYAVSHYYKDVDASHLIRYYGTYNSPASSSTYDEDWYKRTTVFTVPEEVPADAQTDDNGNVFFWVGIMGFQSEKVGYYYDFKLYNVEIPALNLFKDAALRTDSTKISANWIKPAGTANANFSKTTLAAAGGMDIFKKLGNTLKVSDHEWVLCGQNVELEAGKTYSYSYYYAGAKTVPGVIYDGNDKGDTSIAPTSVVYDTEYSKVTYEFVAPETATPGSEVGKVKIYLGVQIPSADTYYLYCPSVYAVDDEEQTNLFNDYTFTGKYTLEGLDGTAGNWYKPYGDAPKLGWKFSKPTLESLGGINMFISFAKKCDVTLDEKIDIRDLVRMKKFSVGTIDSLPEFRGDLNCDLTYADAADLIVLRKEILK